MKRLSLTVAVERYDHLRDLLDGAVRAEGIELTPLHRPVEETFYRFLKFREFDVSELSFAKYAALASRGDCPFVALPVFPSRMFRLSSFYVRDDSPLKDARELAGKRIGLPEWAQTASIYTRGYLVHECGVALDAVEWVQAGVNQPGREEKVEVKLPPGVRLARRRDRSLRELLIGGELDAVLSARPPEGVGAGIRRLYPDYRPLEEAYFRKSGIFPIMHVLALRREVHEAHPWAAMNLFTALEEAKNRSLERARAVTASHYPLPWTAALAEQAAALIGEDFWPYGIEPNRRTLEAFLAFAYEQGVAQRLLSPEELFPRQVQSRHRV